MTKNVVTARADTPAEQIRKLLVDRDISAVPIIDENKKIIGIVTEQDLLKLGERIAESDCAQKIMTRSPITVTEDQPIDEIAKLIRDKKKKRFPVVHGTKLVGIVSRADVLRGLGVFPDAEVPSATAILEYVEKLVEQQPGIGDELTLIVAIADPRKVITGISIQHDFPLSQIERRYGIPFAFLKDSPEGVISNPKELHGLKMSLDVHEREFRLDARIQAYKRTDRLHDVIMLLSTGMGNTLQNPRSVAYNRKRLYHVMGEDLTMPYPCLVEYADPTVPSKRVGAEVLLFTQQDGWPGCHRLDKKKYATGQGDNPTQTNFENKLRWAVSGYPLLLDSEVVSMQRIAENVSDLRHLWQLPRLVKSLIEPLNKTVPCPVEFDFYLGFHEIETDKEQVVRNKGKVTLPIDISMTTKSLDILCSACKITPEKLGKVLFDRAHNKLKPNRRNLRKDLASAGYKEKSRPDDVKDAGDYYMDHEEVTLKLRPAVYPHHIVGVTKRGEIVNISICGLSGRSGITIESACQLCKKLRDDFGLSDALIFDNGNDVVARLLGGPVMSHKSNMRETRLTAAFHLGTPLESGNFDRGLRGFRIDFKAVRPRII
jgi:hypothetical protein